MAVSGTNNVGAGMQIPASGGEPPPDAPQGMAVGVKSTPSAEQIVGAQFEAGKGAGGVASEVLALAQGTNLSPEVVVALAKLATTAGVGKAGPAAEKGDLDVAVGGNGVLVLPSVDDAAALGAGLKFAFSGNDAPLQKVVVSGLASMAAAQQYSQDASWPGLGIGMQVVDARAYLKDFVVDLAGKESAVQGGGAWAPLDSAKDTPVENAIEKLVAKYSEGSYSEAAEALLSELKDLAAKYNETNLPNEQKKILSELKKLEAAYSEAGGKDVQKLLGKIGGIVEEFTKDTAIEKALDKLLGKYSEGSYTEVAEGLLDELKQLANQYASTDNPGEQKKILQQLKSIAASYSEAKIPPDAKQLLSELKGLTAAFGGSKSKQVAGPKGGGNGGGAGAVGAKGDGDTHIHVHHHHHYDPVGPVAQKHAGHCFTNVFKAGGYPRDIMAFVQWVIRESYQDQLQDVYMYAEKVRWFNDQKKKVREEATAMRDILAGEAGKDENAALGSPIGKKTFDETFVGGTAGGTATMTDAQLKEAQKRTTVQAAYNDYKAKAAASTKTQTVKLPDPPSFDPGSNSGSAQQLGTQYGEQLAKWYRDLPEDQKEAVKAYLQQSGMSLSASGTEYNCDNNTYNANAVTDVLKGDNVEAYLKAAGSKIGQAMQNASDNVDGTKPYDFSFAAAGFPDEVTITVPAPELVAVPKELQDVGGVAAAEQYLGVSKSDAKNDNMVSTKAELEAYIKSLEEKLNTIGDDAQLANVDLQNMMQKMQQLLQTLSNVSKTCHDTAMAIVRNLGG